MTFLTRIARLSVCSVALVALAACSSTSGGGANSADTATPSQPFDISSVAISPMTQANLCRDLGGQGTPPTVTIRHTAAAGVPIRLHLRDSLSDGSTFNHRSTTVASDGSGTTTVNYAFLPPCNTTNGRLNSHYRLTVDAGGNGQTVSWAQFNSASRTIQ